jgi:O-antigen/teichoic acid export membrane protein
MKDTDFRLQVGIGTVGNAVGAVVAFGGSVVIAREIGDANYGAFYLMMAIVAVMDNPITGWVQGCRKRFTEEDWKQSDAIGAMFLALVLGSVVVGVSSLIVSWFHGDVRGVDPVLLWFLFTGIVTFEVVTSLVKGTSQFGSVSWINAIRDVLRVALQIGFVLLLADVLGMVLGIVMANLIIAPVVVWRVGIPTLPSRKQLRSIWSFARSSIPGRMIGTTMFRMDVLLLGILSTSALVGNYQIAMNMTMPAMFIGGIVGGGMMSQISNMDSRDRSIQQKVKSAVSYTSIIAIPVAAGALVIGDLLVVTAYSQEFARAGAFIGILAFYRILQTQYQVVNNVIKGIDRPDLTLRGNIIGLFINLALGAGLLLTIGPIGVALASVVSVVCRYTYISWSLKQLRDVSLVTRPLIHQVISGVIMGAVVWMGRQQTPGGWIWVGVLVGLGALVYFTCLWILSEDFRSLTLSFVPT